MDRYQFARSLPVPLRLALMAATGEEPGYFVNRHGYVRLYGRASDLLQGETVPSEQIERGGAWLPCDAFSILACARDLLKERGRLGDQVGIGFMTRQSSGEVRAIVASRQNHEPGSAQSDWVDDRHKAALGVLAKVIAL